MAFKNVKSTNPVKGAVVTALKQLYGGQKITSVQEDETSFRANVHKSLGNSNYELIGTRLVVTKQQLLEMGLLPLPLSTEAVETAPETTSEEVESSEEETLAAPVSESLFG